MNTINRFRYADIFVQHSKHGLEGIGHLLYRFDRQERIMKIFLNYNPLKPDQEPFRILTNKEAIQCFESMQRYTNSVDKLSMNDILIAIEFASGLSYEYLSKKTRLKEIVFARQLAMKCIYEELGVSLTEAGAIFSKDHTTVIHSIKKVSVEDKYLDTYQIEMRKSFNAKIEEIKADKLKNGIN